MVTLDQTGPQIIVKAPMYVCIIIDFESYWMIPSLIIQSSMIIKKKKYSDQYRNHEKCFQKHISWSWIFFSVLRICLKCIMPQPSECLYRMHYEVDVSFANQGKDFPDKYNFTSQSD